MTNQVDNVVTTASPFKVEPTAPVVPVEPTTYSSEFVGDDKKFKDVQSALDSIPFANDHINNLEKQIETLNSQANNSKTMEDYIKDLKEQSNTPAASTVKPTVTTPQEIDYSTVDGLVDAKLDEYKVQLVAESNVTRVIDSMVTSFGSQAEAEKVYIAKAKELNLTMDEINLMAGQRPDLVLKLVGTPAAPVTNTVFILVAHHR